MLSPAPLPPVPLLLWAWGAHLVKNCLIPGEFPPCPLMALIGRIRQCHSVLTAPSWCEERDRHWLLFTGSLNNATRWIRGVFPLTLWKLEGVLGLCCMYCFYFIHSQLRVSLISLSPTVFNSSLSHHRKVWQELSSLIYLFLCAVLPLLLILYLPLSLSFSPLLLSDGWLCSRSAGWHRACLEQYVPIKSTLSHCFLKLNWVLLSSLFVEIA